jgi:hypothetical protein
MMNNIPNDIVISFPPPSLPGLTGKFSIHLLFSSRYFILG